jgi:autotransporter-associated beta strand protein
VLSAVGSGALSPNSNVFVNGGTLDVSASPQTVMSLAIGASGALNLGAGNLLTSAGSVTFGNGSLNILNYTPGATEALMVYGAHANSGSDAFLSFTVDGSASTGYQLTYQAGELDISPTLFGNNSVLVASTSALSFGRVLASSIASLPVTVGLSSGTVNSIGNSTGATATVLSGGSQGVAITSGTASGAGAITGAPQNWTVNVALTGGLGPHSDTLAIQNTGDDGSGASGNFGLPFTGNLQSVITVAVSGSVVSQRTVVDPAPTVLPGTWQGSYHAGDPINVPVAFGYSYPGGGSGALSDTESTSVASYSGSADANGLTLAGGPDDITSSAGFTRTLTGIAAVGSGSGEFTLNVSPELSSTATVTASYSINVTSGNMLWAGSSGANWSTGGWVDSVPGGAAVAPGLNPAWTHSDTAAFTSSDGSAATVALDVSPSVQAIAFTGTTGYTLAGAGGTLSLNNSGSGASISANASALSVIDAPILLADNLTVTGSGSMLFASSSSIADNGAGLSLTLNASGGTLVLSGSDSYSGGTYVQAGTLVVTNPAGIADGINITIGDATLFPVSAAAAPAVTPVPEPATPVLLAAGASMLLLWRSRGRRRRSA